MAPHQKPSLVSYKTDASGGDGEGTTVLVLAYNVVSRHRMALSTSHDGGISWKCVPLCILHFAVSFSFSFSRDLGLLVACPTKMEMVMCWYTTILLPF